MRRPQSPTAVDRAQASPLGNKRSRHLGGTTSGTRCEGCGCKCTDHSSHMGHIQTRQGGWSHLHNHRRGTPSHSCPNVGCRRTRPALPLRLPTHSYRHKSSTQRCHHNYHHHHDHHKGGQRSSSQEVRPSCRVSKNGLSCRELKRREILEIFRFVTSTLVSVYESGFCKKSKRGLRSVLRR